MTPAIRFEVLAQDPASRARAGLLHTPHGTIATPALLPVGTQASVKALGPDDLRALGVQCVMVNSYHLSLRPGADLIAQLGGLHAFMGWSGPVMTDSGGFQVFSLGRGPAERVSKVGPLVPGANRPSGGGLVRIDEEGVSFVSHLDGSHRRLTPEGAVATQEALGADLFMVLDECTSLLDDEAYTALALARTNRWAERSLYARTRSDQGMFAIVQGGPFRPLREASAHFVASLPVEGYAIGGSLGPTREDMLRVLAWTVPQLPEDRPRHLLGIGTPADILPAVAAGIDLMDCAAPTRMARNGSLLVPGGRLNLKGAAHRADPAPVEEGCPCLCCQNFSRAYLSHLFRAREMLAARLASLHNLSFTLRLVERLRRAILEGSLGKLIADQVSG